MALPLPKVVYDVGPGGGITTSMKGQNELTESALTNRRKQLENQYYGPNIESEMANRNALTNQYNINNQTLGQKNVLANEATRLSNEYNTQINPLNIEKQQILNKNLEASEKARIESLKAMANWRNSGGSAAGVGTKEEQFFQRLIARDNPQLNGDPEKIYEASNILRNGGNQLSDGTPLNPLSPASRESFNRLTKGGTTAPILTRNIRANQADAELKILNNYAQQGLKPYGDTFFDMSPQQILDSFKKDKNSQIKLGRFIASQALQYEAAQNRIRLANGQPGVAATEELMKMAGQKINAKYPVLSYTARNEAARFLDEALRKGLEARQSVGIGASQSRDKLPNSSDRVMVLTPSGKKIELPIEGANRLIKDHPDHKIIR